MTFGIIVIPVVSPNVAPGAVRQNWGAAMRWKSLKSRLSLMTRQLARSIYVAGDNLTAADISVTYAPQFAQMSGAPVLDDAVRPILAALPDTTPTSGPWKHGASRENCRSGHRMTTLGPVADFFWLRGRREQACGSSPVPLRYLVMQRRHGRYDLTDFEWRVIEPLLPNQPRCAPRL
jgi:hypothetical protein